MHTIRSMGSGAYIFGFQGTKNRVYIILRSQIYTVAGISYYHDLKGYKTPQKSCVIHSNFLKNINPVSAISTDISNFSTKKLYYL